MANLPGLSIGPVFLDIEHGHVQLVIAVSHSRNGPLVTMAAPVDGFARVIVGRGDVRLVVLIRDIGQAWK
jgi:hypothetical protein